ncbi:MAG: hypothetical protein ACFFEK_14320 [Candidatus Thorarchaeota archaeon]
MSLRQRSFCFVFVITLTLLIGVVHVTPVMASEPEDMHLVYDFDSQTLMVNVSHYTPNTKTHYIEIIEILKNGVFFMNRTYENQSVNWGVYDTFSVSAVVDDNLTVTATCSKGYSLTRWLIVTSGTSTNPPPTDTTTSSTEPTDNPDPSGSSLGTGVAIAAGVGVVVFLIVLFAWLNPDKVPDSIKQLGSRIRPGVDWFGEKMSNLVQLVKTKVSPKN